MPDTLKVNLGERSYPILLGGDLAADVHALGSGLRRSGRRLAVITDGNVAQAHAAALKSMFADLPTHVIPPGEESKSIAELARALDFLAAQGIDRFGSVFAVGGGVVGDLAGFAAASYLRGIDYYQVPTTLLAMVDSSVGGKTGVNLKAGKNLAGAFHQPRGVFISTGLLGTLPAREFAAGMAEVIKTALLEEGPLFAELERETLAAGDPRLPRIVRVCCAIKARVVEADERELARDYGRALLNLGHTFAHAVEQVTGYGPYLHGEAVASHAPALPASRRFPHGGDGARQEGSRRRPALRRPQGTGPGRRPRGCPGRRRRVGVAGARRRLRRGRKFVCSCLLPLR
jgi:3-dehydroquinate synthase